MKIPVNKTGDFKVAPEGTHLAVCNAIIDLGTQPGSAMFPAPKRQVYIRFELPNEIVSYEKDGKEINGPMAVGAFFTASMGKKAKLRQFIEGWFAKGFPSDDAAADFDLDLLIGKPALLNITHNQSGDRTYANIQSAAPLLKGMEKPEMKNAPIAFYIAAWDEDEYQKVPDWLKKKIEGRIRKPEEIRPNAGGQGEGDDDIPF